MKFLSREIGVLHLSTSACAKMRVETTQGTMEGFGEEEATQAQGQTKGSTEADIATSESDELTLHPPKSEQHTGSSPQKRTPIGWLPPQKQTRKADHNPRPNWNREVHRN